MENKNQIIFDNDLDLYANHLEKLNEVFRVHFEKIQNWIVTPFNS